MMIFYATLLTSMLNSALAVESLSSNSMRPNRGIVETSHDASQDYKLYQTSPTARSIQGTNPKFLPYYQDAKAVSQEPSLISPSGYENVYKQPYVVPSSSAQQVQPKINEQSSPYFDHLFTMSASYKVANDDESLNQADLQSPQRDFYSANQDSHNQNAARGIQGTAPISNVQIPVYKTNYPPSQASGPHAPTFQASPYAKKPSLPILQVQNAQYQPAYFPNVQSQSLVLKPSVDPQFSFPVRTPKVNNMQLSAPFLSPLSSFQGQVVPISTTANNPQFPQYKGAAIEVYPTIGGFSTAGYEPLQTQPQLHFGHGNVQHVQTAGGHRQVAPAQEIRSDVEIIKKKKPTTPPPSKDDDDEGYSSAEKEYGSDTPDEDDRDSKPGKPFKAPQMQGDFKPSTFPFKEYDSTFGKYSNRDEGADEKPYSKYREYSSSNDDDDDEDTPSARYHSEDTSSKPYYRRQEDEGEEEEDRRDYTNQKSEGDSDNKYRPKYFGKDFDEEFEASYRRESPKQSYVHRKETPGAEYGSRYSRRDKDSYDSEDSTGQGSQTTFKYRKIPQRFKDSVGQSSDAQMEVAFAGTFGYKTPKNIKNYKHSKRTTN